MLALDAGQAIGHVFQRGLPVGFHPLAALLQQRAGQAVGTVQAFIREAVLVGNPALVDVFVFQRQHAHDALVLGLHHQVRAQAVVRRHRLAAGQFPGAGRVAERLAGQRADRAQVDHVARQFRVNGLADEGGDLRVLAAVEHAQLHHTGHFLAEAHAAGAVDAAGHLLHGDQRAHVLVEHHTLLFLVARLRGTVAHGQVLQLALAALIADRAIQRVVDQQEFHHGLLRLDRLLRIGEDLHAGGHRRGAGRQRLRGLLDLDQAHAAVGRDGQFAVVAEVRDVGAQLAGGFHHQAALSNLNLLAVDL
ncbi:hypothetical protein D3C81_858190 [compost metagenome]